MPPKRHSKGFWARVWEDVEPISTHAIVVLILVFSLAVVGLVIIGIGKLIDKVVTNHLSEYISIIEVIDFWLIVACLVLFGLYTLSIISIRLYKRVVVELAPNSTTGQRKKAGG